MQNIYPTKRKTTADLYTTFIDGEFDTYITHECLWKKRLQVHLDFWKNIPDPIKFGRKKYCMSYAQKMIKSNANKNQICFLRYFIIVHNLNKGLHKCRHRSGLWIRRNSRFLVYNSPKCFHFYVKFSWFCSISVDFWKLKAKSVMWRIVQLTLCMVEILAMIRRSFFSLMNYWFLP